MYEKIKYEVKEGVCWLTLNRPEAYNSFDDQISYEIQNALKAAGKDKKVRALVITGEGKAFCAGQDLKAVLGKEKKSFRESLSKRYNPIIRAMRKMPIPIICGLNGVAAGAGCSLALACDYILASREGSLIEVFINIGLVLDSGSSFFLPRLVGYSKAFELSTLGTKLSAEEAERLGIVNRVVDAKDFSDELAAIATRYATAATKAIGLMKKILNKSYSMDLEEVLEYEMYCQEIAGSSEDYKEGVQAFLEKRKPVFKGN
jgi:2-(1,2-epoxy-1,2-dihydrophenyl)acetyl-CoA isomerase